MIHWLKKIGASAVKFSIQVKDKSNLQFISFSQEGVVDMI